MLFQPPFSTSLSMTACVCVWIYLLVLSVPVRCWNDLAQPLLNASHCTAPHSAPTGPFMLDSHRGLLMP